jgi:hypothetical protein
MINYKIEVGITPNYRDNKFKPYYWVLLSSNDGDEKWYNSCFGWAETPEEAWMEAFKFYTSFKKPSL